MCVVVTVPVCPCELGGVLNLGIWGGGYELVSPGPCSTCTSVPVARYLILCPCGSVSSNSVHHGAPVDQSESTLGVGVGPSQCVKCVSGHPGSGLSPRCSSCPGQALPRPSAAGKPPRAEVGGAAPACKPRLVPGRGRGPGVTRGRGVGASERRGGAGGIAGRPETRRGATCERGTREAAATPASKQQW